MTPLRIPIVDPSTGRLLGDLPDHGSEEMDAALNRARRAHDETDWAHDPVRRADVLRDFQTELIARSATIGAKIIAQAGVPAHLLGGPHQATPMKTFSATVDLLRTGETKPDPGVVAILTPATSPFALPLERTVAALAAGGTVVLKPAAGVASIAAELGEIAVRRLPAGVLSVVTTRDVDVAIAATTDVRVDTVDLVASAHVVERVRVQAAGKRTRLVGPGPRSVTIEDDLPDAVAGAARAVCCYAGQRCDIPTTIKVPLDRYDEAVEVAVATMEALPPGDPRDPATVTGPVISAVHRARVLRYLALAEAEGGSFALGGGTPRMPGDLAGGFWVEPTVITDLDARARTATEELLGPVLVVVVDD